MDRIGRIMIGSQGGNPGVHAGDKAENSCIDPLTYVGRMTR